MVATTPTRSTRHDDHRTSSSGLTPILVLTAVTSAISGFLYGYDTGIISGALLQIRDDFHIAHSSEQFITAGILVGAVVGALVGGRASERIGRHRTILVLAAVFVVGTLACSLSPDAVLLVGARFVLGLAVGAATQTVPMFVAELAPPAIRGRLVLCFQFAIGAGILTATLVGASQWLSWRLEIGLASIPAAALFLLVLPQPESPRWLVKADRDDDAEATLRRVRGREDVDDELEEIRSLEHEERQADARGWPGLKQQWVRPALLVGCGVALFTQLSGIEMIIYYTPTILTGVGFSKHQALLASVALAVTYVVMMIVGFSVIDKVGRRRLTLIMIPGAAVALAVLGGIFITGADSASTAWLIVVCLVVFMFFNAGGLQLIGWLTGSEIYPLAVRGAGTSAQAAVLWGSNAVLSLTILTMIDALGVGTTIWIYAAFNVLAWLFIRARVPELSGKKLEDIESALREEHFRPGEV